MSQQQMANYSNNNNNNNKYYHTELISLSSILSDLKTAHVLYSHLFNKLLVNAYKYYYQTIIRLLSA